MYGKGLIDGLKVTMRHFVQSFVEDARGGRKRYFTEEGVAHRSSPKTEGIFTVQYPEEQLATPEEFRYIPFLIYDELEDGVQQDRCTSCGICAKVCPPQCIWIDQTNDPVSGRPVPEPKEFYIDIDICMNCGFCAEFCPSMRLRWTISLSFRFTSATRPTSSTKRRSRSPATTTLVSARPTMHAKRPSEPRKRPRKPLEADPAMWPRPVAVPPPLLPLPRLRHPRHRQCRQRSLPIQKKLAKPGWTGRAHARPLARRRTPTRPLLKEPRHQRRRPRHPPRQLQPLPLNPSRMLTPHGSLGLNEPANVRLLAKPKKLNAKMGKAV